jgi:uncharacterized membrane protein
LYRSLKSVIAFALLIGGCSINDGLVAADDSFEPVTAVYDCVARERPFAVVTQSATSGLTIFIPEPFVPRTLLLKRVEAASGEKYEDEGVTAWTKGDDVIFIIDTVRVTECDLNHRESVWEAAKLGGVDFRAVGNEPGWVLEIREAKLLTFRYDYGQSEVESIATDIATDRDGKKSVFSASTDAGDLRVSLTGKVCTDTMSDEVFQTTVMIEFAGVSYAGCGRALH